VKHLRLVTGAAILLAQVVTIAYARFIPARYFCWAPFDMQTDYSMTVWIDGAQLTPREVLKRYRRPARGTDNRSVQNLIDMVQLYEERYNRGEKVRVEMKYRINGKEEPEWRWPLQP
jgi:hypothetical protein